MIRWLIALFAILATAPLAAHELRPSVVELREVEKGEFTLDWKVTLAVGSAGLLAERLEPVIPDNCAIQGEAVQRIGDPPIRRVFDRNQPEVAALGMDFVEDGGDRVDGHHVGTLSEPMRGGQVAVTEFGSEKGNS